MIIQDFINSELAEFGLIPNMDEASELVNFFQGRTVFLTGFTGLLGKIYLEKLLRTCQVGKIYVLARQKKGKSISSRFDELLDLPIFDHLKKNDPDFASRVVVLSGDCGQPNLGLSDEDINRIIEETNIVIHCAATVRFDQSLRIAANINVRSVKDLLTMAHKMKELKSFVHVSTAFSNCVSPEIKEKFYDPPLEPSKLFKILEALDDEHLDKITSKLLGDYPNTYVYTKAIAEDVVKTEGFDLPVAVVRPSIVIASVGDPLPGWIDSVFGITGVFALSGLGLLRCLPGNVKYKAELIPADYCINSSLAAAWEASKKNSQEVKVYNIVSSPENKLVWGDISRRTYNYGINYIPKKVFWPPLFAFIACQPVFKVANFFGQTLPAYLVDVVLVCLGKKAMSVKVHDKISKFTEVISYFLMKEWTFTNDNVQGLWKRLNFKDRELFQFNVKDLDWDAYWHDYMKGIRTYIYKDPMETVGEAKERLFKLQFAQYALFLVLTLVVIYFFWHLFNLVL